MDEQHEESIFSLLRRDPEQTSLLVKVGIAVPLAIIIWQVAAGLVLPIFAVAPVTIVLILFYGGLLAYLTSKLMHSNYRWQIESAMQAHKLQSSTSRRASSLAAEPMLLTDAIAVLQEAELEASAPKTQFQDAYFLLRLQEEVQKARREGRSLSVIVLDVASPTGGRPSNEFLDKLALDVASLASKHAKVMSLALQTGDLEFAFSLPGTDRQEARSFISKLVQAMGDYWCQFGLSVYPADGTDAASLLEAARAESLQPPNRELGAKAPGRRRGATLQHS